MHFHAAQALGDAGGGGGAPPAAKSDAARGGDVPAIPEEFFGEEAEARRGAKFLHF